jgi:hypothetical protein
MGGGGKKVMVYSSHKVTAKSQQRQILLTLHHPTFPSVTTRFNLLNTY